ncbi:hypothetical protein VNO77_23717 [Canavalia gladiata]|uniref:Uncharacterized protein n=1 Tax=Canavalia gladiata TaxID=3824 RepID=A0AAN9L4X3_CANGL
MTAQLRSLLAAMEAEEAAKATRGSYTNRGGFQNITGTKNNSGTYAGDGNTYHQGGAPVINNSGQFHGQGNGGYVNGFPSLHLYNGLSWLGRRLRVDIEYRNKMSSSGLMRRILELMEAEEAAKGYYGNYGTSNSFNNIGNGNQDFSGARINGGAYSGDRNRYRNSHHYDGRYIENSGTFLGNGNGGFIHGGFDSSTRNYY